MAHVCTACGFDCSRLRAPPDPVYGLPLVVCPGCGRPSVRRRLRVFWLGSGAGQRLWTCGNLALRVLAMLAFAGVAAGLVAFASMAVQPALSPSRRSVLIHANSVLMAVGLLLIGSLLTAIGLRWVMGHMPRGRRTTAYLAFVCLLMWGPPNLFAATDAFFTVGSRFYWNGGTYDLAPRRFAFEIGHWLWPVMLALVGASVWAFGGLADRFGTYTAQQAWLTRLGRTRRQRARRRT